jgi:quercetin dioxygenase-like cupin family protein
MFRGWRLALSLGLVAAAISVGVGRATIARATPGSGLRDEVLGRATLPPFEIQPDESPFGIQSEKTTDVVIHHLSFAPRGSTGWHTHPGPAFITVVLGAVTLYNGDDPKCRPHIYTAGQGFVDPGFGHVHIARNEGTVPAGVYAADLNVPPGGLYRIDAPNPGVCASRGF